MGDPDITFCEKCGRYSYTTELLCPECWSHEQDNHKELKMHPNGDSRYKTLIEMHDERQQFYLDVKKERENDVNELATLVQDFEKKKKELTQSIEELSKTMKKTELYIEIINNEIAKER